MNGRKIVWVIRLPQPSFAEDQHERDGCMMPPITWRQRLVRQVFPHRGTRDCCHYHRQGFHAIADSVIRAFQETCRRELEDEEADQLVFEILQNTGLTEAERDTASLLLREDTGIHIDRLKGERRWSYWEGRHRARALMDAGVRRIVVSYTDERHYRD